MCLLYQMHDACQHSYGFNTYSSLVLTLSQSFVQVLQSTTGHAGGFDTPTADGWHTLVVGFNGLDVLQLAQIPELHRVPGCCCQEVSIL